MSTKIKQILIKTAKCVKNLCMKRLSLFFQEVLKISFVFLLCFIWIRYFVRKLWLANLLSVLFTGVAYAVMLFFNRKKQQKQGLKLKEKEEAENMFLSLACNDKSIDFFVKLASKKHKNITKHKNYIVINHEMQNVKTLLYADLSFEGLSIARFMEIYAKIKKEKAAKIVIVCKEITDKQLENFCSNFKEKFLLLDEYGAYQKLYKYYTCFPEITHKYNATKKMAFKDFVAYSFNKKRTKGYLFSALILILSGIFVRMSIYYCVVASVLIVCAVVSQFNPYFNTKGEPEVL